MAAAALASEEAAAALAAALLPHVHTPAPNVAALQPACHCSLAVRIGDAAQLCLSRNLLLPAGNACLSSVVATEASLAGRVMADGKSRLLRTRAWSLPLEDLQLICPESGCATVVCLPLQKRQPDGEQSTASAPRVLGALTVGFAEGADVSAAVLQRAVLVAHAVARHQQPALQEFAGMLASMLLPQQPAAVEDSSDDDGSSSEWERELSDRETDMPSASGSGSSAIGEGAALHAVLHPRVSMHPFTLRFSERRYEHSFAAFHAAHLQRIDGLAYLICAAFICLEALLPATRIRVPALQLGWWGVPGRYVGLLPGLLLAFRRTRSWFTDRRDWMLCFTWLASAAWPLALRAGGTLAPHDMLTALTVLGLAFQMRLRMLGPVVLAFNAQLLPHLCTCHLVHGISLPLACSYCFEARTRRLFLQHAVVLHATPG